MELFRKSVRRSQLSLYSHLNTFIKYVSHLKEMSKISTSKTPILKDPEEPLQDPDILQLPSHRQLLGLLGLLGLLQPAAAWMGSLWTTSQETHTEGLGCTRSMFYMKSRCPPYQTSQKFKHSVQCQTTILPHLQEFCLFLSFSGG